MLEVRADASLDVGRLVPQLLGPLATAGVLQLSSFAQQRVNLLFGGLNLPLLGTRWYQEHENHRQSECESPRCVSAFAAHCAG